MKKYQIITLIFLIWMLVVSVKVQQQLRNTASTAIHQIIEQETAWIPTSGDQAPCDADTTSIFYLAGKFLKITPMKEIMR